jgi:hypothetical protein
MQRSTEERDAVLGVLAEAGIRDVTIAQGAKSTQLRWVVNGQTRMVGLSISPSDRRALHNKKAEVRRMLRLDGLVPQHASAPAKPAPVKAMSSLRDHCEKLIRRLQHLPTLDDEQQRKLIYETAAALRKIDEVIFTATRAIDETLNRKEARHPG